MSVFKKIGDKMIIIFLANTIIIKVNDGEGLPVVFPLDKIEKASTFGFQ